LRNVLLDFRPNATDDSKFSFAANLDRSVSTPITAHRRRGTSAAASAATWATASCAWTARILLHLDPIFAKPWQYIQANARLTWKLDKEGFTLIAPYLKVLGEEGKIAGDFLIRLHFDHSQEDYMDLRVGWSMAMVATPPSTCPRC
jgi:uncharacterized protein YhdP